DALQARADHVAVDAQLAEDAPGLRLGLDQAQHQVFRADVVVARALGLALGERQRLPGVLAQPLEGMHPRPVYVEAMNLQRTSSNASGTSTNGTWPTSWNTCRPRRGMAIAVARWFRSG